jgi:hypothetical protein
MEDRPMSELTPAQEDPAIHRMLSTLPAWMPGPGFDNRVLARVWRPHPLWLRRVEGYWGELVETGQVWLIVGAFALGSLIPIIALTALVAAHTAEIGAFLGWLVTVGIPVAWAAVSGRCLPGAPRELRVGPVPHHECCECYEVVAP